jgi:predicted RNase H-like HicB family nuclease
MTTPYDQYLNMPYTRLVVPVEDGTYSAEILEFPGCFAQGNTAEEAIRNLDDSAQSWVAAALDQGQEIPPPMAAQDFSGRLVLRMPRSIHKQAARYAQRDNTSLNQFLTAAISTRIGAEEFYDRLLLRLEAHMMPVARTVIVLPDSAFQNLTQGISPAPPFQFFPQLRGSNSPSERAVEVAHNA